MVISIHSFSYIYYFLRSNLRQIALNCFQIDVDPVMGLRTLCWGIQKEFVCRVSQCLEIKEDRKIDMGKGFSMMKNCCE